MAWIPHPATVIAMYGDSTTQGNGAPRHQSEPAWLQTMVPPDVLVINEGVSGTTATQLLEGTDGVHPPFDQVVAKSPAQIVTLQFGLNDTVRSTPDQFFDSLSALVDIAAAAGKRVVLQEPNASCLANRVKLPAYVAAMRKVANEKALPLVRQYEAYPEWREHLPDCLHPDGAYYRIKAQNTFNTINALLPGARPGQNAH
ncbi:SGNH/GDSL hydrolase family protein [Paraburkholderia dinghuensis]|nr:SGNH/GDSL hydrolase family protein [Paraburkholderia dinghuensis]